VENVRNATTLYLSETKVFERDAPEARRSLKILENVSQNSLLIAVSQKLIIRASCERLNHAEKEAPKRARARPKKASTPRYA
jgi:hypothetical protein